MVFQHMALMPHLTVRDNVALPLAMRGESQAKSWQVAHECLELVKLAGHEERYPSQLSGGMQQRVGLARALAPEPSLLLMDEPFSALDPLIRKELQQEFKDIASHLQKTSVFITHDLDEAINIGHRIAMMRGGRIVQIGTPEEIINSPADDYVRKFVASNETSA
ncbi:MAG: ATP-binding cassette domain-containing protein, partial [Pseudomonadota bacterium]|nr:ATP-binding cassette domain-containing protein [Pseudomonadota bacterium]